MPWDGNSRKGLFYNSLPAQILAAQNLNHFTMFTDSVGLETRRGTVKTALLSSALSGASAGTAEGWNIWACIGYSCNSWDWRSRLQGGFLIHTSAAWAEVVEGELAFGA